MTEQEWQSLLDRDPADTVLRLHYSDWLEEQGRIEQAEVQRWLANRRKYPNQTVIDWEWYLSNSVSLQVPPHGRYLPRTLFERLPGRSRNVYRTYSTRQAAEAALVAAWSALKAKGGRLP